MSMIINKTTKIPETQTGRRYPDNWGGPDYIPVPPRLEKRAEAYGRYCDLVIENGVLVDILPLPRPEPEPREPTDLERAQQDITDLQLADIERGQEITDIQIAMLEVQK